jgi:hypothetical protein
MLSQTEEEGEGEKKKQTRHHLSFRQIFMEVHIVCSGKIFLESRTMLL